MIQEIFPLIICVWTVLCLQISNDTQTGMLGTCVNAFTPFIPCQELRKWCVPSCWQKHPTGTLFGRSKPSVNCLVPEKFGKVLLRLQSPDRGGGPMGTGVKNRQVGTDWRMASLRGGNRRGQASTLRSKTWDVKTTWEDVLCRLKLREGLWFIPTALG